jgi:hypothetical protein
MLMYLAPNRWDGPRQRTQHLAAGLARTRPVIFVEPAAYTLPGLLRRRLAGEQSGPLFRRVKRVSDGAGLPPPTLPGNLILGARSSSSLACATCAGLSARWTCPPRTWWWHGRRPSSLPDASTRVA